MNSINLLEVLVSILSSLSNESITPNIALLSVVLGMMLQNLVQKIHYQEQMICEQVCKLHALEDEIDQIKKKHKKSEKRANK